MTRLRLAAAVIVAVLALTDAAVAWTYGDYEDVWVCSSDSAAGRPNRDACGPVEKSSIWWVVVPAGVALLALGDAVMTGRRTSQASRRR